MEIEIIEPNLQFTNELIPLKSIERLIIHHTEKYGWDINRTHHHHINKNGWDGIGYNYFIESDGTIKKGRGINVGAHAYGFNFNSIGICINGNYDFEFLDSVVRDSLYKLCVFLIKKYDLAHKDVYGHKECKSEKTCPGLNIDMDLIRNELAELYIM